MIASLTIISKRYRKILLVFTFDGQQWEQTFRIVGSSEERSAQLDLLADQLRARLPADPMIDVVHSVLALEQGFAVELA